MGEPSWSELLGSNDWEGLLDPLDDNLRGLILRCGDFCQGTYDAFNNDQNSKFCGSSRYGKKSFFYKVMLESGSNYQVHAFLYATARVGAHKAIFLHSLSRESWDRETNWVGYIAVTTDEYSQVIGRREIYVAFRGTTRNYEWIDVMGAGLKSAEPLLSPKPWKKRDDGSVHTSDSDDDDDNLPKIMQGWLKIYLSNDPHSPFTNLSARDQLLAKIEELRNLYEGEELSITFTGHSLGASLSTVAAFDLVENGLDDIPVCCIVFGCPQVGNKAFKERLKEFPNLKILHVKNKIDLIPHYPSRFLGYHHTGIDLVIDTRKSPFLKESKNVSDWHNLQAMLHVVAGWNGAHGEFELKVKRSSALVNKSCGFLKDECLIPECWWVEKNKGLVLDENGDWVAATPAEEDLPVPEI